MSWDVLLGHDPTLSSSNAIIPRALRKKRTIDLMDRGAMDIEDNYLWYFLNNDRFYSQL